MNPFKKGDKVKAIDSVINRCNIAGDLSIGRIMEVMGIVDDHLLIDGVYMHYSRFTFAEPPSKFANVKVGDWVETIGGKQFKVGGWDGDYFWLEGWGCRSNAYYDKHGLNRYRDNSPQEDMWDIRRIVPPSKVVVEVTLKVKNIRRLNDNSFVCITNVKGWTFGISYDDIPQSQAEQVRQLIEAQTK